MSRVIVQYVLPLLLPTLVFVGWLVLTRKPGETRAETMARLQGGPWYWLVVAGFVLMAAGFIYLGLSHAKVVRHRVNREIRRRRRSRGGTGLRFRPRSRRS